MNLPCVECDRRGSPTFPVDDVHVCLDCVTRVLDGCIPEHIGRGGPRPVYWWFCVCGLEVRRGPFRVDPDDVADASDRERRRIARYQSKVEGIASGGVMLCRTCAAFAGVPLPAPARLPENVIELVEALKRGRPRPQRECGLGS